ncbi:MAG: right-handed parallel beta-helix repeat-containing protein [Ginsengibacter sp.]
MKNILFLFLVIIAIPAAKASSYYFSSISGNDLRTPLEAKSPSTPWKTLNRLNLVFSNLSPGDSLLLKRGETFYGSIIVNKSGKPALPIVVGAYGSGTRPVITGFISLKLLALGNNIYQSQTLTPSTINVVLINGLLTGMGRYPRNDYLIFESHNDSSSLADNQLSATPNWTGSELVLRRRRWILDRCLITNHSANTITYVSASTGEPYNKYGYFIQKSPLTLTYQNAWYYHELTKKLSIYSTSMPTDVKVAVIDDLISNTGGFNYITFDNLAINGANKTGINNGNGKNFIIQNCDISNSGQDGISLFSRNKIVNCTITNSLNNGIIYTSSFDSTINSTVSNTGIIAGGSKSGAAAGIGIYATNTNSFVEYNRIINTGYSGIHIDGNNSVAKNNFIDTFCTIKDDGGGIYTNMSGKKGRRIIGNIIMDGIGAGAGTDNALGAQASGIYIDLTSDVDLEDNTITNCNLYGIYMHNASEVIVKNNTLANNNRQFAMIQKAGNNLIRNNVMTQNIFFSRLQTQPISYLKSAYNDTGVFGKFDNNYYAMPLDDKLITYNKQTNIAENNINQNSDLEVWNAKYNKDEPLGRITNANAKKFSTSNSIRFEYNPTKMIKTIMLNGNYVDLENNKYPNSIVLQPYTSAILIKEN